MEKEVEVKRIERVRQYLSLDVDLFQELRDITSLASSICEKPISLITLLDENINWVVTSTGADLAFAPRETSFCQFAIKANGPFIIQDAKSDERFNGNPLVYDQPGVRFYASSPLITSDGFRLGTLCLFDLKPGNLNDLQKKTLEVLSRQVIFLLEAELNKKELKERLEEVEQKNESLRAIAQLQSHEIRQPLTSIMGLLNLAEEDLVKLNKEWLSMVKSAAAVLDNKIRSIVSESLGTPDIKLLRFNRMVEEIEDYAILLLDANGNIENWNKGAEKIKGYKTKEIIGRNFSLFYPKEQQEAGLPQKLLNIATQKGVARDEGLRVKKDGSTFMARVVITAIHNEDGETIGFTKVTRDISGNNML